MSSLALIGLQWGDEGKGKIIDFLAQKFDVIIRYQGGPNAGHTVYLDNQKISISSDSNWNSQSKK
jgi:adenylosuccinate synthase